MTDAPKVVDVRWYGESPADLPDNVKYVGRPTIFGNPYKRTLVMTREDVLDKHEAYLTRRMNNDKLFKRKVMELAGYDLACWCKSKHPELRCHADAILTAINNELACTSV